MACGMREIGGYFGFEQSHGKEFYPNLLALNTGRNALLYVLKARGVKKIYIPYYLCDTVSEICKKYKYEFEYYHVDKAFKPIFSKQLKKSEYIYIVNYFGQISNSELSKYKERYINVIFDNVQSFFQKPVGGIDTIYSCRKFFGVPDGSYLSTGCVLQEELEQDVSSERMKHILGRFETSATDYYDAFQRNDESFYDLELKSMSRITHNLLKNIDYKSVKKIRERNFDFLAKTLSKKNDLKLRRPMGPYCYPFLCENGMLIKKQLAKMSIYIPTLWPNVLEECPANSIEYQYAANILPLPVDQRYGKEEMEMIVEEIRQCTN